MTTTRTTCISCAKNLNSDGHCGPCEASATRCRSFRSWWGRFSKKSPRRAWIVRNAAGTKRRIRYVDPARTLREPWEVDPEYSALVAELTARIDAFRAASDAATEAA